MDKKLKTPTRKNGRHLRVPVLPSEEIQIKSNAAKAGLSIAEYLRRVSLGYPIQSTVDKDCILQLSKINADMGRLGGLLKLWLSQDKRVAHFDQRLVMSLLSKIRLTQDAMLDVVKKL
ncbi:TPA: conjugal transfer transcriptional regulator TraJ [Legionella pneumophila]|uniref:Conjugal transfer relaxosome component TraJ n=1 Tax=Legionella waltersii TaxID=66969 RepID=A0A0W1AGB2_9GAMM|nr:MULTISPECIES: conjugal transfer transcriptional regulator TraJ [Legionella]KTD80383.1 conjugal transfer relaxosome component TraJ [Legionella waltersii]MBN5937361.1 conjugal transfer transcriptional regulator TraJ [Legionella anisa]SNV10253.1 traJ protein [Legionella waltersii]HAT1129363.1 conjugal transfer transcriptional regulator TraJ [Legionella pneumophila]HAT1919899.1 conjugal transfer transcriptional regulator TraJ [Legionella pneumophila]